MKKVFVLMSVVLFIMTTIVNAEEAKPADQPRLVQPQKEADPVLKEGNGQPADPEAAKRRELMEKARAIQQKLMDGQQVTDEERKLLEQAREMRGQQFRREVERRVQDFQRGGENRIQPVEGGRPGFGGGMMQQGTQKALRYDDRLNVIDNAYFEMAELQITKQQPQPAIDTLEQLLKVTNNAFTISLTHFNIGQICRTKLNNTARAAEEYQKVTGECSLDAIDALVQMFEELDKVNDAVAALNKIAAESKDDFQKCVSLKKLSELLAKNDRHDEAVEALRKLTQAIPYEKAEAITKALNEEKERRAVAQEKAMRQRFQFFGGFGQGGRPGFQPGEMDPRRGQEQGQWRGRRPGGDAELRPQDRPRENNEKLPRGAQPQEMPIQPPQAQ